MVTTQLKYYLDHCVSYAMHPSGRSFFCLRQPTLVQEITTDDCMILAEKQVMPCHQITLTANKLLCISAEYLQTYSIHTLDLQDLQLLKPGWHFLTDSVYFLPSTNTLLNEKQATQTKGYGTLTTFIVTTSLLFVGFQSGHVLRTSIDLT